MPTMEGAFNNDGRIPRFFTSVAHLMLAAIAVQAVARIPFYLGIEHWLINVAGLVTSVLVVIGMLHNDVTRLCVRCMQEVPADAGAQAQRRRWVLWVNHFASSRRGIVALISAIVATWVLAATGAPPAAQAPIDLACTVFFYSIWLHHRLRPWCPYCRDWGSDGMCEPSPDPVERATL
ncbi:hypothetical protein [Nocardia carnea]|uniref:hypothetical protein n=1 Tax=Nocardia carnea TaxID=37328 RepID=UPI002457BDF1|nr:hypothetical protein [Nocardia carnea]